MFSNEHDGTLHLTHSTFVNNAAMDNGGAVLTSNLIEGLIEKSTFQNNTAKIGGAVFCEDRGVNEIWVHNCTFKQNEATNSGGALAFNSTSATIMNSNLVENIAPEGGTIFFMGQYSTLNISWCNIRKNNFLLREEPAGAAVVCFLAEQLVAHNVAFHDNDIGGVLLGDVEAKVDSCSFSRNRGNIGAIRGLTTKVLIITNTSFIENGEFSVPALHLSKNTLIQNCTFYASGHINLRAITIIPTNSTILRSCGNVFSRSTEDVQIELDTMIYLLSHSPIPSTVTLYFWNTWYQVNSSQAYAVDGDFVKNIYRVTNIFSDRATAGGHVFVTVEVSQFASSKYSENTHKIKVCMLVEFHEFGRPESRFCAIKQRLFFVEFCWKF